MRERGQGLVALVIVGLLVAGASWAERVGAHPAEPGVTGVARSSIWLCPHGGGVGWTGKLSLANPGTVPAQVRLSEISGKGHARSTPLIVEPGSSVVVDVSAGERGAATFVEVFEGWASASWIVRAEDPEHGTAAEPCLEAPSDAWYAPDGSTDQGQDAYVVVMNPFDARAVFDVVLFSADRAPLRDTDWADVELGPRSSAALKLDTKILGEDPVSAAIEVKSGRVAVASLGVSAEQGVRAAVGSTSVELVREFPIAAGTGQGSVVVTVLEDEQVRFGTIVRSGEEPLSADELAAIEQAGQSARRYPFASTGASSVVLETADSVGVVASLRAQGPANDGASTGGVSTPGPAWLVSPVLTERPVTPWVVVSNGGEVSARVTFRLLLAPGRAVERPTVTVQVPAGRVGGPPAKFLEQAPYAPVLVSADADVVASAASIGGGVKGVAHYGLALGVRVPDWVLASS